MKKRQGKVIKHFTVEFDPTIGENPSNPFSMLSDEERLKDFIETFSLLWAESCREVAEEGKNVEKVFE